MNAGNSSWTKEIASGGRGPNRQIETEQWYVCLSGVPNERYILDHRFEHSRNHVPEILVCKDKKSRRLWRMSKREALSVAQVNENFSVVVTIYVRRGTEQPEEWHDPSVEKTQKKQRRGWLDE